MRDRRPGLKRASGGSDAQRYLRLLAVPIIVVILVLVIVIVDKSPKSEEADAVGSAAETAAQADTADTADGPGDGAETAEGSEGQAEPAQEDRFALSRDEIPEINSLMEAYCQAKADCDAETMYQLYGKTDTSDLENLRTRMQWRAKYIESFQNIVCYTIPGLEDGSYLVYVSTDIKFRVTDTLAPNLMWCYVVRDPEGNFIIQENVSKDVLTFVAQAEQSEGVRTLAAQVNARLKEAVESDTKLASAYGMLREDVAAPGEETTAAMSLETTAAETTDETEAAEAGGSSLEGQVSQEGETAQAETEASSEAEAESSLEGETAAQ